MIESSVVLYNGDLVTVDTGGPSEVEFDFFKIWQYKNKIKNFNPACLEFHHVHPSGMLMYSEKDVNCLKGFNISFGGAVYFSIVTFDSPDINDLSHKQISFEHTNQKMHEISNIGLRNRHLQLLKVLSYGNFESKKYS